jgi:diguanylate cyclase (GGDEF)-like protein
MKSLFNRLRRKISQFVSINKDKYHEFNVNKNWNRFPRFAVIAFVVSSIFFLQHTFYPNVDRKSFLYDAYLIAYGLLPIITALYTILVYILNKSHIRIHFVYLSYFGLFIICVLYMNILKLYHSDDLSLYTFVMMAIPLIIRTRLIYYSLIYTVVWLGFMFCVYIFHFDKVSFFKNSQLFLYALVGYLTTLTIEYARRKTFHLEEELRRKNTILESISVKDPLTGLFNRRYMMDLLVHHILLSRRHCKPFSQGIIDIDHFKRVNDTLGHLTGDDVLKEIARIIKIAVRISDLVFRFGGEEFIILFPETNLENASIVMERIRKSIESNVFNGVPWKISASGGFTELLATDSPETILKRSDELLYKAKMEGRNRVLF